MGMSIDESIDWIKNTILDMRRAQICISDRLALETAIDTMRKYQKLQADYENRLKADVAAMLEELKKEIEELKSYESVDGQDLVMFADIGILFQQKINSLKIESESKDARN